MSTLRPLSNNNNNRNLPFIIAAVGLSALLVVGLIALVGYMFFFQRGDAANQIAQASPTALPTSTAKPATVAETGPVPTATTAAVAAAAAATDTPVPTDTPAPTATQAEAATAGTGGGEGEETAGAASSGGEAEAAATAGVASGGGAAEAAATATMFAPLPSATVAPGQESEEIPPTGLGGLEAIAAGLGLSLVVLLARRLRTA